MGRETFDKGERRHCVDRLVAIVRNEASGANPVRPINEHRIGPRSKFRLEFASHASRAGMTITIAIKATMQFGGKQPQDDNFVRYHPTQRLVPNYRDECEMTHRFNMSLGSADPTSEVSKFLM